MILAIIFTFGAGCSNTAQAMLIGNAIDSFSATYADFPNKDFETYEEAAAYAEHEINQIIKKLLTFG